MWAYIIRRTILTVPTVLGIVLITMVLFSGVAADPARTWAGKFANESTIKAARVRMGIDKPKWFNFSALRDGKVKEAFNTQLFDVVLFRFPNSMRYEESLWSIVKRKAPASMLIQVPAFIIIVGLELSFALLAAARRARMTDYVITLVSVLLMSVPVLSVYIYAQWMLGQKLGVFPVAGWDKGIYALHFAALPILITVLIGVGAGIRLYRAVMLEEVYSDYVRTARAKGVSDREVFFTHVLRNAMIPVITQTVTALPGLILGALLLERIFQIPGLGNVLVEALSNNDRPVVMGLVYILSIIYCVLLLLSDILYTVVNPQVSLK